MCDYSLEHFNSIPAKEGETYLYNVHVTHGFITQDLHRDDITVVCCQPGQRLQLTNLHHRYPAPREAIVTFVQRSQDPNKYNHFGGYNDGLLFEDGHSIPLASLLYATMTVLAPVKPKADLGKLFDLGGKTVEPDLVDAD